VAKNRSEQGGLTSRRGRGPARRDCSPPAVSEVEKAYFAGYTDAEGCIGLVTFSRGSARYWSAFVCFGQTQPMAVERLHALYGGRLNSRKRGHRRRQKEWRLSGIEDVRRFLSDVSPYLREKHAQAAIVLNEFDPKAAHATNEALLNRLVQLKAKCLGAVSIESRLSIAPQAQRTCLDCDAQSFSRGFCAKHYQRARREGRITTNPKGNGVPFTYGRALNEGEPPYFAGYFDGDGCVAVAHEKRRWYPRVAFAQTQPDTLMELHALYGGSLTVDPPRDRRVDQSCFINSFNGMPSWRCYATFSRFSSRSGTRSNCSWRSIKPTCPLRMDRNSRRSFPR